MKRPLFTAAIVLVVVAALRLNLGTTQVISERFDVHIIGQVCQKNQKNFELKNVIVQNEKLPGKLLCEVLPDHEFALGSYVELQGDVQSFDVATNQGEFDARKYYRTMDICGKVRNATLVAVSREYWGLREKVYQMKQILRERIQGGLSEKHAGIIEALLLGERTHLDEQTKELYQRNGIYHILSISSLHITMIGMFLYHLLRYIGAPPWLAGGLGVVTLLFYGLMTGFGVSVIRAIGMFVVKMVGQMVGRTYDMLTALGLLGGIMVTVNPYYLQHGGFLLSYTCVLGIGLVYPVLIKWVEELPGTLFRYKWMYGIVQAFVLSLSIFLTTLPLQLRLYYEVSVYSVFLNLLIIPFMQPLMLCGFLLLLLPQAGIFHLPIYLILEGYEFLCKCFEKLPGNLWNPGCPSTAQVVLYYLLLGVGLWYLKRVLQREEGPRTPAVLLLFGSVMTAIFIVGQGPSFGIQKNQVFFLDVGQGDGIFVETATGEHYLFDCGSSSRKKVGEYVLLPFLKYHGVRKLDGVFVSHPDADHMSGILELLRMSKEEDIEICQLILPTVGTIQREEFEELQWPIIRYVSRGDTWSVDDVSFQCLYPPKGLETSDTNEYSQCFLINFSDDGSLLLMGDLEGEGEQVVTDNIKGKLQKTVVLKVAHHGSKNGTSEAFLRAVAPDVAVISAGKTNRYGHPHEETLKRLENANVKIFSTAQDGQITIWWKQGKVSTKSIIDSP